MSEPIRDPVLEEIARVSREYPDGVHTCAELQRLEPGRRPCTCGRCGETFETNCREDDISCAYCGAQRCPHCRKWFGGDS